MVKDTCIHCGRSFEIDDDHAGNWVCACTHAEPVKQVAQLEAENVRLQGLVDAARREVQNYRKKLSTLQKRFNTAWDALSEIADSNEFDKSGLIRMAEDALKDVAIPMTEFMACPSVGVPAPSAGDRSALGEVPNSEGLLPCPFCGSTYIGLGEFGFGNEDSQMHYASCSTCGCTMEGMGGAPTREQAIAVWNYRSEFVGDSTPPADDHGASTLGGGSDD